MADVLWSHRADHLHLRRDHVESLRAVLADAYHLVAARTLLVLFRQVDHPLHPRQPFGQRLPFRAAARFRRRAGCLIHRRRIIFRPAVGAAFDLVEQPQLLALALGVAELLGAAPIQLVLQPGDLFFVQFQLAGQILELRVQFTVSGNEFTVVLGQLVLFPLQAAILLAHRIASSCSATGVMLDMSLP